VSWVNWGSVAQAAGVLSCWGRGGCCCGWFGAAVLTAGVAAAATTADLWVQKAIDPFICFGLLECKIIN